MSEIILIGPIRKGKIALTGDTMKNQLFLKRFDEVFDRVRAIDTVDWKKRPWVLPQIIWAIMTHPKAKVIVSANPGSADSIIKILNRLHLNKNIFYWVVGGSLHKTFERGVLDVANYRSVKAILVQGKSMVESMKQQGLTNAVYVPNSKYIDFMPEKPVKTDGKMHFVFLSRLEKYKGCDDIISASDILKEKGYEGKYDITFYGKTTDKMQYFEQFREKISSRPEIAYRGPLNLRESANYSELAKCDVMLFPTYWDGEGFPGVVIDAYIAGLPIIASDWNLNKDVVEEGVTGWIVPPKAIDALVEKMIFAIEHPTVIEQLSHNCRDKASLYDSRHVLSEENLKKIGLL